MERNEKITPDQKRQYLEIFFRDGKEAAQIYLDETLPKPNPLLAFPVETQAEILRLFSILGGVGVEFDKIFCECKAKDSDEAVRACFAKHLFLSPDIKTT